MIEVLIAISPLVGVALGAFLQHKFSTYNYEAEKLDLRRHDAYSDYLRATAAIAQNQPLEENRALLADAKCRIAIYGSQDVLQLMGKFEEAGADLADSKAVDAFLRTVNQMRRERSRSDSTLDGHSIRLLLFGSQIRR
jgi:hypothetical protein